VHVLNAFRVGYKFNNKVHHTACMFTLCHGRVCEGGYVLAHKMEKGVLSPLCKETAHTISKFLAQRRPG